MTSTRINQGSLEKWLIPGLGQGRYTMRLAHIVVLESNEVPHPEMMGHVQRTSKRHIDVVCL